MEAGRGDVLSPTVLLRSALPGGSPSLEDTIVSPAFVLIMAACVSSVSLGSVCRQRERVDMEIAVP